jgi:hypothetical protein
MQEVTVCDSITQVVHWAEFHIHENSCVLIRVRADRITPFILAHDIIVVPTRLVHLKVINVLVVRVAHSVNIIEFKFVNLIEA